MSTPITVAGHTFPAAMVRAAAAEASRDADRVIVFLTHLGLPASPDRPVRLPADALLALAAALRLVEWEAAGHTAHRDAGLPAAGDAVRAAARSLFDLAAPDRELRGRVAVLTSDRFSWHARDALGAAVALDALDPAAAAAAVAAFVWAARRPAPAPPAAPED